MRSGSVHAFLGWGEALTDPDLTEPLRRTMHSAGGANLGAFKNARVDEVLEEMRSTLDAALRRRIFRRELEPLLRTTPGWILPIAHGVERTAVRPGVALPAFGFGWDGHRYEEAALSPDHPTRPAGTSASGARGG